MAHTRVWSKLTPDGSTLSKHIDDKIREKVEDVEERMDEICRLGGDGKRFGTEPGPIDLLDIYKGDVANKYLMIPFNQFYVPEDAGKTPVLFADYLSIFADFFYVIAPLHLPVGCVLKSVEMLIDRDSLTSVTWDIRKHPFGAGASSAVGAQIVHNVAGKVISSLAGLAETFANTHFYVIRLQPNGSSGATGKIYGARVTYSTPDCRSTY